MHVPGVFAACAEPWPPTARNTPATTINQPKRISAASRMFIELLVYASGVILSSALPSSRARSGSGLRFRDRGSAELKGSR